MGGEGELMTETKLPTFRTALASWRDAACALLRMPVLAVCTTLALFILSILDDALRPKTAAGMAMGWGLLWDGLMGVIFALVLTPLGIAASRYVVLGEMAQRAALDYSSPRFRKFFAYSVLVTIPITIFIFIGETTDTLVAVGLFAVSAIIVLITSLLFPAIAVDAPGANPGNAIRDIRFGRGLAIMIAALLPLLLVFAVAAISSEIASDDTTAAWLLLLLLASAFDMIIITVLTTAASRLYLAWGSRLGSPASGAA